MTPEQVTWQSRSFNDQEYYSIDLETKNAQKEEDRDMSGISNELLKICAHISNTSRYFQEELCSDLQEF